MARIVSISDTHGYHRRIKEIPDGDILIHAGDITNRGEISVLHDFALWMKSLPHAHKLIIAGNHDLSLARDNIQRQELLKLFEECGITYLQDSGITISGLKFYGSPWTPLFHNWGFNLPRGQALADKWAQIPDDTNVLITHGPPYGILDEAPRGVFDFEHVGCEDLLERIWELRYLQASIFGHIHHSSNVIEEYGVKFVNSSICTEQYQPTNPPRVFEVIAKTNE